MIVLQPHPISCGTESSQRLMRKKCIRIIHLGLSCYLGYAVLGFNLVSKCKLLCFPKNVNYRPPGEWFLYVPFAPVGNHFNQWVLFILKILQLVIRDIQIEPPKVEPLSVNSTQFLTNIIP